MGIQVFRSKIIYCEGIKKGIDYPEHPGVYLNVVEGEKINCPYCNKNFTFCE